ncbi:SMI1/KNR4 family protein [Streptomyces sp. NPDC052701]|uniref:SMI1/KNR4 family protein n=1 Tax=Streptomyces sp. NPDC052701 TaxID=3155533 RepID=UPI0034274722
MHSSLPGAAQQADAAWTRIENWLARHAPQVHSALAPPASPGLLERVAETAGATLPADLVTWWSRSHGLRRPPSTGALFPDRYNPLPLEDALRHRAVLLDTPRRVCPPELLEELQAYLDRCSREPAGTLYPRSTPAPWLPAWIPIAHDAGGGGLFADLRAGTRQGCVIRYTRHGHAPEPDWPSLAALLTHVADGLETISEEDAGSGAGMVLGRWTPPG